MISQSERADYKEGLRDRKRGQEINPVPRSDAYYKGVFGEPLEDGKSKRAWRIALALALPVSLVSYAIAKRAS